LFTTAKKKSPIGFLIGKKCAAPTESIIMAVGHFEDNRSLP
jgi:hypothetical protein